MSIFIPPKADPDLLRCLRDIEQQLNELNNAPGPTAPVPDSGLLSRLETVESRLNGLSQFERVSQPFADYKNDGNPSRVLHEDGTWVEPLAGIAKAVTPSLDSVRTRPTNLVNLLGSLAVTGALSADTARSRRLESQAINARPVAASFSYNAYSTAASTHTLRWATQLFDASNGIIVRQTSDEEIKVTEVGYYELHAVVFCTLTASAEMDVMLNRYNSGGSIQETRSCRWINLNAATTKLFGATSHGAFSAAANDFFTVEILQVAGTVTPYTADTTFNNLIVERMN